MRRLVLWLTCSVALTISTLRLTAAERDRILYCGACIALVEELNWFTGIVDPKRKLQVGSYQLDAKGDMHAKEVSLANSETHMIEVMETVCRYMFFYTQHTDNKGHTNYIRTASRDGSAISKRHVVDSNRTKTELEFACDTVLEEHEDKLMSMYQAKEEEIAEKVCADVAGLCSRENVTGQFWAYASAVMMGMSEKAAAAGDKEAQEQLAKLDAETADAASDNGDVGEVIDGDEAIEVIDAESDDDNDGAAGGGGGNDVRRSEL